MKVVLTGPTGFIGSHVLTDLYKHGHEVTALVRDHAQADAVAARGATPAVVDLYDRPTVARLLSDADGAIHTASPGDATSANLDSAVVDAVIDAFAGTGKPYLQISGLWIYGANSSITEESPFHAPAMVSWKEPIERRVLGAAGIRAIQRLPTSSATGATANDSYGPPRRPWLDGRLMSTFPLGQRQVRRSGYGAMQLAGPWAFNPPADRASAIGVLQAAVTAGIDHIDTAQYYGPDVVNDLIRETLWPYPRELAIVSKVAVRPDAAWR